MARKNRDHAAAVFPMLPRRLGACVVEHKGVYHPPPPPASQDIPGPEAPDFMAWLAPRPGCDWPVPHTCLGRMVIHHEPPKGMGGGRRDDRRVNRICTWAHDKRHNGGSSKDIETALRAKQVEHLTNYMDGVRRA